MDSCTAGVPQPGLHPFAIRDPLRDVGEPVSARSPQARPRDPTGARISLGSHGRDLSKKVMAQRRNEGEGGSGRSQGSVCGLGSGVGVGPMSEAGNQEERQVFGDSGVIPALETLGWRGQRVWARKLLTAPWLLGGPRRYASSSFKAADLQLEMTQKPHKKPDPNETLVFGKTFTDHMLMVEWTEEKGWNHPRIQPFQNLTLHPACSALHYSLQVARQPASVPVSLSHLFPPAVSVAGSTSLGLLLVSSFRVSIICSLRFPMFQALCWLMLRFPKISRSSSFP
ncbi:Branched-chain-amino-acid aminotransferase, mitochondrial [Myotis brandtii]|uniref:branched-chain-amino-acid transaminase n=1 Tax=Myotis brandtii TaxID=109478 RepID=S7NFC8_MYOBR|nr:Branched-chain-amino-acid aminotransferase, mitochondrial [Myotis brandtii]